MNSSVKTIDLEKVTANVFKRVLPLPICLPSDYIKEFNKEIEANEIDLNEEISKKIAEDYEKSKKLIQEAEKTLGKTSHFLEQSLDALTHQNYEEVLKLKKDMDILFKHIKSLTYELHTDELTKAYNRKWFFNDYLVQENYMPETGTMIFIDIDNFKNINDKYGHQVGDKILKYFVSFIKNELKVRQLEEKEFKIVRFAGDEFIVMIRKDIDYVEKIFKEIYKKFCGIKVIPNRHQETFYVSFSYGLKDFKRGNDIHDIMKNADGAMYNMKSIRQSNRS